jgi:DNA repair protein RecO (recombination protein O)
MKSARQRIDRQRGYVLHTYPYSETSLIADVFSREHGRLALLARGARRPRSALRGTLLGFQPLELGWFGSGEVKTLAKAEWCGGLPLLQGKSLLVGYYLNELLLKLLPREDAHDRLFDAYEEALLGLAGRMANPPANAPILRRFETALLRELGYGLLLDREADGGPAVIAESDYEYVIERGPIAAGAGADPSAKLSGRTLLDMAQDRYDDARTLAESKQLMRRLLAHYLGGQALQSRKIFMELQEA